MQFRKVQEFNLDRYYNGGLNDTESWIKHHWWAVIGPTADRQKFVRIKWLPDYRGRVPLEDAPSARESAMCRQRVTVHTQGECIPQK